MSDHLEARLAGLERALKRIADDDFPEDILRYFRDKPDCIRQFAGNVSKISPSSWLKEMMASVWDEAAQWHRERAFPGDERERFHRSCAEQFEVRARGIRMLG